MTQLTKKAIKESMVKLLNQMPLDKITVKDIVEDCGISRNTFYYYYQDIYALLEEIFADETRKVVEDTESSYETWQEAFLKSAIFALQNKRAIYHVYNSVNKEQLVRYLYGIADHIMLQFVRKQAEGLSASEEDIRYVSMFYKYAFVGIILEWLDHGMKDDPEYSIAKIEDLLKGSIHFILTKHNP